MDFLKLKVIDKKYLFLIGVFFAICIIFLLLLVWPNQQTEPDQLLPTPAPVPSVKPGTSVAPGATSAPIDPRTGEIYSEEYIRLQEEKNRQQIPRLERDAKVSQFLNNLPYNGTYIRVTYSIRNNEVTIVKSAANPSAADQELNQLLQQYQIEDISWIQKVVIQSN